MKSCDHTCKHCGKSIVLVPSANERAKKYGNTPEYYRRLFTVCNDCKIAAWNRR